MVAIHFLRVGVAPDFYYTSADGKRVSNKEILEYIKSLVIPPKYTDVKIYFDLKGTKTCAPVKLTYTGVDDRGRVQYGYSAAWKVRASRAKFKKLIEFGGVLPRIRAQIAEILKDPHSSVAPTLDVNIALILRIVHLCHFRLGTEKYRELYKSYGVSTIEVRHLKIRNGAAHISFIGKKGVKNTCIIDAPDVVAHLANMAAGKEPKAPIFATNGVPVRAADVNAWMKQLVGVDVTSKSFRTFATNIMMIEQLNRMAMPAPQRSTKKETSWILPESLTLTQRKKNINTALDEVSGTIHNTRAVCKKEYTLPNLIEMYLNHPRAFAARFLACGIDAEACFLKYLKELHE